MRTTTPPSISAVQASAERADAVVAVPVKVEKDISSVVTGSSTVRSQGSAGEASATAAAEEEKFVAFLEPGALDAEGRNRMIAELAYYRAEARGFTTGHELEDWLEAEAEVDRSLHLPDPGPREE